MNVKRKLIEDQIKVLKASKDCKNEIANQFANEIIGIDSQIKNLEASLAEEQKPEIRHGDYGFREPNNPRIVLFKDNGNKVDAGKRFACENMQEVHNHLPEDKAVN
jgi:hypothetical protein